MRRFNQWGVIGLAVTFVVAFAPAAFASFDVVAVPEVSPASLSSGLALLAGGVLLVRARFGRK